MLPYVPQPPKAPAPVSITYMGLLVKLILLVWSLWPQEADAQHTAPVVIPAGTEVVIEQVGHLHSRQPGGATFMVAQDLVSPAGELVVKRGTPVAASVSPLPAKGLGKGGQLWLAFSQTTTTDGHVLPLQGTYVAYGQNRVGLAVGLTAGLIFAFPWNFFCLMIRGHEALLVHGTQYFGVVTSQQVEVMASNP